MAHRTMTITIMVRRSRHNILYNFRVCEGLDVDMEQGIILHADDGPVTLNIVSNRGDNDASFKVEFTVTDQAPTAPSGRMDVR